jgi:hypothetical protein
MLASRLHSGCASILPQPPTRIAEAWPHKRRQAHASWGTHVGGCPGADLTYTIDIALTAEFRLLLESARSTVRIESPDGQRRSVVLGVCS